MSVESKPRRTQSRFSMSFATMQSAINLYPRRKHCRTRRARRTDFSWSRKLWKSFRAICRRRPSASFRLCSGSARSRRGRSCKSCTLASSKWMMGLALTCRSISIPPWKSRESRRQPAARRRPDRNQGRDQCRGTALHLRVAHLADYRSNYDASVIRKLRAAGAIPFGQTNLDEFAMGSSTENSAFQPDVIPGTLTRLRGLRGGSAAAVAADEAFGALGQRYRRLRPATGCAQWRLSGLKPTYGRVSRFGLTRVCVIPRSDRSAGTKRPAMPALCERNSGPDPQDSTCLDDAGADFTAKLGRDLRGTPDSASRPSIHIEGWTRR